MRDDAAMMIDDDADDLPYPMMGKRYLPCWTSHQRPFDRDQKRPCRYRCRWLRRLQRDGDDRELPLHHLRVRVPIWNSFPIDCRFFWPPTDGPSNSETIALPALDSTETRDEHPTASALSAVVAVVVVVVSHPSWLSRGGDDRRPDHRPNRPCVPLLLHRLHLRWLFFVSVRFRSPQPNQWHLRLFFLPILHPLWPPPELPSRPLRWQKLDPISCRSFRRQWLRPKWEKSIAI